MLGNGEKMTLTSTNEWPQREEEEVDRVLMVPLSGSNLMEKPSHDQALRCPRCDSSNTKFCYYNNYSLSQPRHFCKACKRYWTRGGTLRNVPVGGGCRKNKRIKRPAEAGASAPDRPPLLLPPPNPTHHIDVSTTSSDIEPLFYSLPNNSTDMNLTFPQFNSRLTSSNGDKLPISCSGYDLQPQLGALGLNYSSGLHHKDYGAGFNITQMEEAIIPSSLFSDYSLFGSSSSPSSSLTATLMASTLQQQQQKLVLGLNNTRPINDFQVFLPFQDLQLTGSVNSEVYKGVKLEDDEEEDDDEERNVMNNKMEWQVPCEIPFDAITATADSSLYWNPTAGAWPASTNFGSTIAPLI